MRHDYTSITYTEAKTLGNLWRVSRKVDGVWCKCTITPDGKVSITNRRGKVLHAFEHEGFAGLEAVLVAEWIAMSDTYDGALFPFDVLSFMGTDVSRKPHQERTRLLTDMVDGRDCAHTRPCRLAACDMLNKFAAALWDQNSIWYEMVVQYDITSLDHVVDYISRHHDQYDGVVLVHKHSRYNDRPHLKLKNAVSVDYVLTAINLSESKYHEGTAATITGALLIGGKLVDVCKVGNLPHKLRSALTLNPADYIGKVFEATGNKAFKSGALRHPVFLRWREDKLPSGCTLAQVKSQRPDARSGAA